MLFSGAFFFSSLSLSLPPLLSAHLHCNWFQVVCCRTLFFPSDFQLCTCALTNNTLTRKCIYIHKRQNYSVSFWIWLCVCKRKNALGALLNFPFSFDSHPDVYWMCSYVVYVSFLFLYGIVFIFFSVLLPFHFLRSILSQRALTYKHTHTHTLRLNMLRNVQIFFLFFSLHITFLHCKLNVIKHYYQRICNCQPQASLLLLLQRDEFQMKWQLFLFRVFCHLILQLVPIDLIC